MLSSGDLSAIESLVGRVVEEKMEAKFEEKLSPIRKDIRSLKKTSLRLDKKIDDVLNHLDRRDLNLRGRVERIETHLGFAHTI